MSVEAKPTGISSSTEFSSLWNSARVILAGPPLDEQAQVARIELWRRQEWHDWFRWHMTRRGRDWSKPIWLGTLAAGLFGLIFYGLQSQRWEVTAGGVVIWFAVVNLGFFAYLGLRVPGPPLPIPGPFSTAGPARARVGIYPPGYDGRKLARIWLRIAKEEGGTDGALPKEWLIELALPGGLPEELSALAKKQETFRMQRGDAPAITAVCEVVELSRAQIDAGAHPLRLKAWHWDPASAEIFGRP